MHKIHLHKPDWYALGVHLDHLIHDPRFWAALALGVLLTMMIISMILTNPGTSGSAFPGTFPKYPYVP